MGSEKHVFWQALVIAFIVFWTGILIGTYFERSRIDEIQGFYFNSETDIFDLNLVSEILADVSGNCALFKLQVINFADRIYFEALKLEKYDNSNKLGEETISLHKRYDLLRTLLWKSVIDNKKNCGAEINTIVYLYDYVDTPVNTRAVQDAIEHYLVDLKNEKKSELILIPIAVDTGVESLEVLREIYGLNEIPVIFVNEEFTISNLQNIKDVEKHLN